MKTLSKFICFYVPMIVVLLISSFPSMIHAYGIQNHTFCKGVNDSEYPWKPIAPTSIFDDSDKAVYSLVTFRDVYEAHTYYWIWIDPNGDEYDRYDDVISDPADEGFESWIFFSAWDYIAIKDNTPAELLGLWKMEFYVDGLLEFTDTFEISEHAREDYLNVINVEAPLKVDPGEQFNVTVTVDYLFIRDVTISVVIWDLDKEDFASGTVDEGSWVNQDVASGSGALPVDIQVEAPNEAKTLKLVAVALVWVGNEFTIYGDLPKKEFEVEVSQQIEIVILDKSFVEDDLGLDLEEVAMYPGDTATIEFKLRNEGVATAQNVNFVVEDLTPRRGVRIISEDFPRDLAPGESGTWKVKVKISEVGDYTGFDRIYVDGEKIIEETLLIRVEPINLESESIEATPGEDESLYPDDMVIIKYRLKNMGNRLIRQLDLKVNVDSEGLTLRESTPPTDLDAQESSEWVVEVMAEKEGEYEVGIDIYAQGVEVYKEWYLITVRVSAKGLFQCVIATATFDSALSPEVSFLRGFRDNTISRTYAGYQFMTVFNTLYYSFSPTVANFIHSHQSVKTTMKFALYPLMGILHLSEMSYSLLNFSPELAVVTSGFVASSLIGIVYCTPNALLMTIALKRIRKRDVKIRYLTPIALAAILSVVLIAIGEVLISTLIMQVATASFILATISLTSMIAAIKLLKRFSF